MRAWVSLRRGATSSSAGRRGMRTLRLDRPEALLGAFQLVQRLLERGEAGALLLDDLGTRLVEEVLVAELLLGALEVAEQLAGLARQPGTLLVEIHQPLERQEHLRSHDHRRGRHRRPRAVA